MTESIFWRRTGGLGAWKRQDEDTDAPLSTEGYSRPDRQDAFDWPPLPIGTQEGWIVRLAYNGRTEGGACILERSIPISDHPLKVAGDLMMEATRRNGAIYVRAWSIEIAPQRLAGDEEDPKQ